MLVLYDKSNISRTGLEFPLFLPMWENSISGASVADKKQIAGRWPHAGHTSIHDVIVMLKLHHYLKYVFSGEWEKETIIRVRVG